MYEKLNTEGKEKKIDEYADQNGFGWTNGAILDLLVRYRDTITYTGGDITPPDPKDCKFKPKEANKPDEQTDLKKLEDPKKQEDPKKLKEPKKQEGQKKKE
jgi:hypothetical protein